MSNKTLLKLVSIYTFLFLTVGISSCTDYLPAVSNKILQLYISPKISNYKIEKIGLLPMVNDDTTKTGTFYSTNYFLKMLKNKFTKKTFEVMDLDKIVEYDSLLVSNLVEAIETKKRLDLKNFYSFELDSLLSEKNLDAIFIGTINNNENKYGASYDVKINGVCFIYSIACDFTYYLVSLKDGRVLWKANVLGQESFYYYNFTDKFPPLDAAISNGIDTILPQIPL